MHLHERRLGRRDAGRIDDKAAVTSCPLGQGSIHVEHIYAAPGSYTVKLRTTEFALGQPLASVAMYRKAVISVP